MQNWCWPADWKVRCCSRSCRQSSCCSRCGRCSPSMLVNEVEVEAGFPDVPVELVVLTPLMTITGEALYPILVEKLVMQSSGLSMYSSCSLFCQGGRCIQYPSQCCSCNYYWWNCFFQFCCKCRRWFLSKFFLLSMFSRCCCSIPFCRCRCQRCCCGAIFVSELLLNKILLSRLLSMSFSLVFSLMLSNLSSLNSANSILLMSGFVVEDVCCRNSVPYLVCRTFCRIFVADDVDYGLCFLLDVEHIL